MKTIKKESIGLEFRRPYQDMRACSRLNYFLQRETLEESHKLGGIQLKTVAQFEHKLAVDHGEPLLVMMDALLRHAKAYRVAYESTISQDGVLGDEWLAAAKGVRALLNGQGGVAMECGMSGDSKDNGVIEGVFWRALEAAGYTEADV